MVTIGPVNKTSPTVQFWMDAVVYDQNAAGNWSRVQINVRAVNTGSSSSNYGGAGQQIGSIDGVGVVVNHAANPFLPSVGSGAQRWNDAGVSPPIYHDANGNLGVTVRMQIAYGGVNEQYTAALYLPSIAKVPSKPITPVFISATTTTIDFSFYNSPSNGGSAEIGWDLQSATDSGFTQNLQQWVDYANPGQATNLIPGTQTWIRYRSVNAIGFSVWSDPLVQTTLPAVPPGLTVTAQPSGDKADLVFTPPGGVSGVSKYTWERRVTGTTTPVATGDTTTTAVTIDTLTPGTRYDWRGSAWIGTYQSPSGDWQTVQQPKPNTNPGDYFDGGSTDTPDEDYAWDGAANNSTSTATGKPVTGWQGSFAQGATGVLYQVIGGYSGGFAARVLFHTSAAAVGGLNTGMSTASKAAVASGATYVGSVYAKPDADQSLVVRIIFYDAAGVQLSGAVTGPATFTPGGQWTRLAVSAASPAGAAGAILRVVDVAGTGWHLWQGGDGLLLDAAMITLGDLIPYFDGSTPGDEFYDYAWEGTPNASESTRTQVTVGLTDPLADPDCPPLPAPPRPPVVPADCIDEVGVWRRYWVAISDAQISDWLDVIPTITISTGAVEARQVRIRIFENPGNLAPSAFTSDEFVSEQIVSYMPAKTTLTLDGVSQRTWAAIDGGDGLAADRLVYGSGGAPATWPVLSCGLPYLLAFDAPLEAPAGNLTIGLALTERAG